MFIFVLYYLFVTVSAEQGLEKSNYYRKLHGVNNFIISKTIQNSAQNWAEYLAEYDVFQHSPTLKYGENLAMFYNTGLTNDEASDLAVKMWYEEIDKYNYSDPRFSMKTGHFTQVVWASSKMIGTGIARSNRFIYVVTQYYPYGNVYSQFQNNVFPLLPSPQPMLPPIYPPPVYPPGTL